MKRIVLVLLTFLILLGTVSCNGSGGENTDTEAVTETPEKRISVADLSSYTIVYSSEGCSMQIMKAMRELQATVKSLYGTQINMSGDFLTMPTSTDAREILVGLTNREISAEEASKVKRVDEYRVSLVDNTLVIAGGSDEALLEAINAVLTAVKALPQETEYFFCESMAMQKASEYPIGEVMLAGSELCDYTVVYQDNALCKRLAEEMQASVGEKTGYALKILSDTSAKNDTSVKQKLLIGKTLFGLPKDCKEDEGYYIGVKDRDVYLYGSTNSLQKSVSEWITESLKKVGNGSLVLDPNTETIQIVDTSMRVMTFNVLYSNPSKRADSVIDTIRRNDPDLLGVQEATGTWVNILENGLKDYARVGLGRDKNNTGETASIFYKKEKFTLIETGTKWMSDTPDKVSKYSGSTCNRIFTYALLERKSDGERFMLLNAHTEFGGDETKINVRKKQFAALANWINQNVKVPYILIGDMNSKPGSSELAQLKSAIHYENSSEIAYTANRANTNSTAVIDYILLSKDDFSVFNYDVDTKKVNGAANNPSDHCPVIVVCDLKKK